MRRKSDVNLVPNNGTAPSPVSSLSAEEQARFGELADVALHQKKPETNTQPAGSLPHEEHERLKQELLDMLDKLEARKK